MTIFVASLFLPYTVNFEPDTAKDDDSPSPKTLETKSRHAMTRSLDSLPKLTSLITPATASIPRTASSTKLDDILIAASTAQKPPLLRLPSATRLASFTRTDTHAPNWGKPGQGVRFAQPFSRAKSPPPSSILRQHEDLQEEPIDDDFFSFPVTPRTSKSHDDFEFKKFSIEPSNMGNGGLVAAIDAACDDKIWVGTLGMPTNALSDAIKTNIKQRLEVDFESIPVLVDDNDMTGLYEQYCKTILWPHLHYQVPDHPKNKAYEDHSWGFYLTVNQAFADSIVESWKKGDKIWIHDYHLMLVPEMVRKKLPDAEIGFFMHAAFPSSEIFRCLATRKTLLKGILGANLVGFQTDEYVHHFLQTSSRLLNVEATKNGILLDGGRFVHVDNFAIGVDPKTIQGRTKSPEIEEFVGVFATQFQQKKLIIARDKMDSIRGVYQKLLAYERFLKDFPEYRENVVLIQIATTTTVDANLTNRVMDVVTRITSSYTSLTHNPLVFLNQDLDPSQWLALLGVADCLMVTSLREGMNLTGHEFILCQDGVFGTTKHCPLILSEFTGAASVIKEGALLVNPWDQKQVAHTLAQALKMQPNEKLKRWEKMHKAVIHHDASKWYEDYINALSAAYKDHSVREISSVPRLVVPELKRIYDASAKRLLILDYEDTLASWGSPAHTILPTSKRSIDILNDLIEDHRNTVYVMSARTKQELEGIFSRVPGVGLIAENGGYLRMADHHKWMTLCDEDHIESWKEGVISILNYYQDRIKGSKVEELDTCVLFKYDQAEDATNAFNQAAECANHINDICAGQQVKAIPIERGIFISDKEINKATATKKITDELFKGHSESGEALPEFLLVVGDSREDEYVFDWAHKLQDEGIENCVTVAVGQRNTAASFTVAQGVVGVLSILRKLVGDSVSSP